MSEAPQLPDVINLENFESLIYSRRYEDAFTELIKMLTQIKRGSGFTWYGDQPPIELIFTRIASAIGSMLSDPLFGMSYEGFCRLMIDHATLHSIFKISVFGSMDHIMWMFGQRDIENPTRVSFPSEAAIQKFLLCWSLDSKVDIDLDAISKFLPGWAAAAMIAYLAIGGIHTERAYQRKLELMRKLHLIENVQLPETLIGAMGDVYMHCSYTDAPDKHDIKKVLNHQWRSLVDSKISSSGCTLKERFQLEEKERPTIVIPLEWFGSHHAMYRCYAPSIRQLRQRFKIVGVARSQEIDDEAKLVFDEFVTIPSDGDVSIYKMADAILGHAPDIVYYPSIGMAAWWVALSNYRLAPIQIMTPGHPATSHSRCIDYILSEGDLFGDESLYSEKCVPLPVGSVRYMQRAGLEPEKLVKPMDDVIRLAIPCMVMKLIPPFLAALKRIHENQESRVEFHFMPNQVGSNHHLVTKELQAWIPGSYVHHRMEYQPYMEALARCDLVLSTFPFGGTNSTIDAFLCGVPVLTLEGNEIHAKSDASMMRRVGLPEWLITHSVDEYVAAALKFIKMGGLETFDSGPLFGDPVAEFYGAPPAGLANRFLTAFEEIYDRHIELQEAAVHHRAVYDGPREPYNSI